MAKKTNAQLWREIRELERRLEIAAEESRRIIEANQKLQEEREGYLDLEAEVKFLEEKMRERGDRIEGLIEELKTARETVKHFQNLERETAGELDRVRIVMHSMVDAIS